MAAKPFSVHNASAKMSTFVNSTKNKNKNRQETTETVND
jgi:hypothetical protein